MSRLLMAPASQSSRSVARSNDYEGLTDEELEKQVDELKEQVRMLRLENELLQNTIMRLDPSLMTGLQQALEYAAKLSASSSIEGASSFARSQLSRFESMASPSRLIASPSRVSRRAESSGKIGGTIIIGSGLRINVIERTELVTTEMEILESKLENENYRAAKTHALLKAQLEEISIRVSEIKKSLEGYDKEVIVEGWDRIAQRIPAEIWLKYMREWIKEADTVIGKLRLRTSTLNCQYSKLKGQIKIKTELNDKLRPVDFEKLQIENDECLASIDKKAQQLVELKQMTGDANLNLTIHKKAAMEQHNYLTSVLKKIETKQKKTVETEKERGIIEAQAVSLEHKLEEIKRLRLTYEVPDIMDYVKVKSELADLKHVVKILENRLHVSQIALTSLNKRIKSFDGK